MAERGEDAEFGGIADKYVEPAPPVEQRPRQLVDLDEIAQIEGNESSAAADRANRVVNLLEASDRARRQDDMRSLAARNARPGCRRPCEETRRYQLWGGHRIPPGCAPSDADIPECLIQAASIMQLAYLAWLNLRERCPVDYARRRRNR